MTLSTGTIVLRMIVTFLITHPDSVVPKPATLDLHEILYCPCRRSLFTDNLFEALPQSRKNDDLDTNADLAQRQARHIRRSHVALTKL